jgi:hypothetical protein
VTTYELGDGVPLRYLATDRNGDPVATTVTLTITRPNATVDTVATVATELGQYDAATYVPVATGEYTWKWVATGTITDVATGTFTVVGQGPGQYAELALVRSQIGKLTSDDRDELISASILAASRMIDVECGLWPGAFRPDAVASTRVVELVGNVRSLGWNRSAVSVGPIATPTGLVVAGGNSFTGVYSSWVLGTTYSYPANAVAMGEPIEYLQVMAASLGAIDAIQVTARWGYPSTPSQIELACRMLAARLYRRKDSPQGVITSADWGAVRVSRTDPDIHALLFPFITPGFA